MKTLAIANQKGGVGKTALAIHLAHACEDRGLTTVVVDLDTQSNATRTLSTKRSLGASVNLFDKQFVSKQMVAGELHVISADERLADVETAPGFTPDSLTRNLAQLAQQCDLVIIDTAPSLTLRMIAALAAADFVVCPIELEAYSIQGADMMLRTINGMRSHNPKLKFLGMLPSKFDTRSQRQQNNLAELKSAYATAVIPAEMGLRSSFAETLATGDSVLNNRKTAARSARHEITAITDYLLTAMGVSNATTTP